MQLSTLNGPIFKEDEIDNDGQMRAAFLNNYLESFLSTFSTTTQIKDHEFLNLASLIENLMASANMKKLNLLNGQYVDVFFNFVCVFVINCFKAEKNCTDSFESKKYLESYEKILISWTSITSCIDLSKAQEDLLFKNYSQSIISGFVESRLSNIENMNSNILSEDIDINNDNVDEESLDDNENSDDNDDLQCYKEVLYSFGEFAKYSLDYSLPMLS